MTELTISLSEKEEKFLKSFAQNQFPGAPDNQCTVHPIHVVESKQYDYTPYSEEIAWAFDSDSLAFTTDEEYEHWETSEIELIENWYLNKGKDCPIEIKSYEELEYEDFTGVDGETIIISNYHDYFKLYGIPIRGIAWRKERYEKVAFFFILEEANKYIKYQGHNLRSPRIYTHSSGYGNEGDFNHFWELLMKMGKQLTQTTTEIDTK